MSSIRNPVRVFSSIVALCLTTLATAADAQSGAQDPIPISPVDTADAVIQYDLTGPRFGFTVLPTGMLRSQFGWHFENQVTSMRGGPSFIVEKVLLVSGIEDDTISPSFTLVFGMRSRDGFEFGLGPSASVGAGGFNTAIVVAAGHSYRFGGIRVPVNLAVALDKDHKSHVTFVTGWAIRERPESEREREHRRFRDHYRITD